MTIIATVLLSQYMSISQGSLTGILIHFLVLTMSGMSYDCQLPSSNNPKSRRLNEDHKP
jgi:hypothetical protein